MKGTEIRKNDYMASIRNDISLIDTELDSYAILYEENKDLIRICWLKFQIGMLRMALYELYLLKKKYKWNIKRRKKLCKLLILADRYIMTVRE